MTASCEKMKWEKEDVKRLKGEGDEKKKHKKFLYECINFFIHNSSQPRTIQTNFYRPIICAFCRVFFFTYKKSF